MALVERLMGLEPSKIAVHAFFAAVHQRVDGVLTRQNVIDMFAMDVDDITEWDAVAALFPTGSTALAEALKAKFIERIHAVFILAEGRYAGYETAAAVRAKLGV